MIKAIMAVDDKGGISKGSSMPWPKNSKDLQWFKKNTLNQVVVMGSKTWEDPFMPTPLKNRENVLITTKDNSYYLVANKYLKGDIVNEILELEKEYSERDIFVIGGPDIIVQTYDLFKEFYLTRIYGNFECDKFIDSKNLFDITKESFFFLEKYFDIPYPYEKYDQIFVPEFNFGAMENVGCVTFSESYIFKSKKSIFIISGLILISLVSLIIFL